MDATLDDAALGLSDAPTAADDAGATDGGAVDGGTQDAAPQDATVPNNNPFGIALSEAAQTLPDVFLGGRPSDFSIGYGSGGAIGDLDGDGDLDLVIARCDAPAPSPVGGPSTVLWKTGAGLESVAYTADATMSAAMAGTCAHSVSLGDYDRDGDLDLFFALNGFDRLFRNDSGTFTDVTVLTGVGGPAVDSSGQAIWADLNRDGLLDLYVAAGPIVFPPVPDPILANRTYIARADGTFAELDASAGAAGVAKTHAALISDLDNDGELEFYLANDTLAVNGTSGSPDLPRDAWLDLVATDDQGLPSYQDRGAEFQVDAPRSSMGVALVDLDRNGSDEIYVSDFGRNHLQFWNASLLRYEDRASSWDVAVGDNPLGYYNVSWSARFLDLDRDGLEELFFVNGSTTEPVNCGAITQLDYFLRRVSLAPKFVDITGAVGLPDAFECPPLVDTPAGGRGAAFGDLDGDGDDDFLLTPYVEKYRIYRNDTPPNAHHFVRVTPVGSVSAPTPVGVVLEVVRLDGTRLRKTLYGGGDTLSQSASTLELGIGLDSSTLGVTLVWPSGYRQRIDLASSFAFDQNLTITEPEWLSFSARVAALMSPDLVVTYRPHGIDGTPVGAAADSRMVTGIRSDGAPVNFVGQGGGVFTAALPHPGVSRTTVLTIFDDGVPVGIRPTVVYQ